jgi:hypothetical protein
MRALLILVLSTALPSFVAAQAASDVPTLRIVETTGAQTTAMLTTQTDALRAALSRCGRAERARGLVIELDARGRVHALVVRSETGAAPAPAWRRCARTAVSQLHYEHGTGAVELALTWPARTLVIGTTGPSGSVSDLLAGSSPAAIDDALAGTSGSRPSRHRPRERPPS